MENNGRTRGTCRRTPSREGRVTTVQEVREVKQVFPAGNSYERGGPGTEEVTLGRSRAASRAESVGS